MHSWNVHMLLTCKRHQIFTFSGKHLFTCSATMRWESGGCVEHQVVWDWWGGGQQRETNRGHCLGGGGGFGCTVYTQLTHTQCFTKTNSKNALMEKAVQQHWSVSTLGSLLSPMAPAPTRWLISHSDHRQLRYAAISSLCKPSTWSNYINEFKSTDTRMTFVLFVNLLVGVSYTASPAACCYFVMISFIWSEWMSFKNIKQN